MILRDYQTEAIERILDGFSNKKLSQILVLPTGAGKTVIFANMIKQYGKKTLILAHTNELLRQTHIVCNRQIPNKNIEILTKNLKLQNVDVCVSTIQSAFRDANFKRLMNAGFELLIIDEAHHAVSDSYLNIIDAFKSKNLPILGVTATPYRLDNKKLSEIFPYESLSFNILDMIDRGYLCDIEGYRIQTNLDLSGIRSIHGEFNSVQLASVVDTENRNEMAFQSYKELAYLNKSLIFCVNINHCDHMAQVFNHEGIKTVSVHGKLPKEKRNQILSDFKHGKIQVLTTCQLLTEGFDEPSIECLIMARPTKSPGLYTQMIGRGLRTHFGKTKCKIIELTDNAHNICDFSTLITQVTNNQNGRNKINNISSLNEIRNYFDKPFQYGQEIVITEEDFIRKYNNKQFEKNNKYASPDQIKQMKSLGITFIEPITSVIANIMINKEITKRNGNI